MMPPARALFDGTMVASTASVDTRAYDRPNDRLPSARMKRNAIRRPRPVLSTPRAMKNAQSTSQTMGSAYPRSESTGVMVPVTAIAQTPRNTTAPAESGWTIEPTIVAAKIANSRHEVSVMPSGAPKARIMRAVANTAAQRHITKGGVAGPLGSPGTGAADGVGIGRNYGAQRAKRKARRVCAAPAPVQYPVPGLAWSNQQPAVLTKPSIRG